MKTFFKSIVLSVSRAEWGCLSEELWHSVWKSDGRRHPPGPHLRRCDDRSLHSPVTFAALSLGGAEKMKPPKSAA